MKRRELTILAGIVMRLTKEACERETKRPYADEFDEAKIMEQAIEEFRHTMVPGPKTRDHCGLCDRLMVPTVGRSMTKCPVHGTAVWVKVKLIGE